MLLHVIPICIIVPCCILHALNIFIKYQAMHSFPNKCNPLPTKFCMGSYYNIEIRKFQVLLFVHDFIFNNFSAASRWQRIWRLYGWSSLLCIHVCKVRRKYCHFEENWMNFLKILVLTLNSSSIPPSFSILNERYCIYPKVKHCIFLETSAHFQKKYRKKSKFKFFSSSSLTVCNRRCNKALAVETGVVRDGVPSIYPRW